MTSKKILVSIDHPVTDEKRATVVQRVTDAFGVLPEHVVTLTDVVSVSVVEVPAEMCSAREAHDKQEAAKKAKEEHEAERKAAKEESSAKAESHKAKG